jgi:hypothetical protein
MVEVEGSDAPLMPDRRLPRLDFTSFRLQPETHSGESRDLTYNISFSKGSGLQPPASKRFRVSSTGDCSAFLDLRSPCHWLLGLPACSSGCVCSIISLNEPLQQRKFTSLITLTVATQNRSHSEKRGTVHTIFNKSTSLESNI